jgi:enoyl-CoA hydratase
MACTFRLAATTARFGQPEINLGLIPGYGGTQRLPRLVGKGRALELVLTGRLIDAEEAERIGLVHQVLEPAALMAEAGALAERLAGKAPVAMRLAMEAIGRGMEMALPEAEFLEAALFGLAAATEDMREGTAAFLEKREPRFTGK